MKRINIIILTIILFSIVNVIAPIPEDRDYYTVDCSGECGATPCIPNIAEQSVDMGLEPDAFVQVGCFANGPKYVLENGDYVFDSYGEWSSISAYCNSPEAKICEEINGFKPDYVYTCYGTDKNYNKCYEPNAEKYYSAGTKLCYEDDWGFGVATCVFDGNYADFEIEECPNTCSNGKCTNNYCEPNKKQVCYNGDLYYADSCGNIGILLQECKTCTGDGYCEPECTPSCSGRTCGSDGCGGTCGTCPSGQSCSASGTCVSGCTAKTCSQLGKTCGYTDNGCGTQINCGSCTSGKTCSNNQCVSTCTPDWDCGSWGTCVNNNQIRTCQDLNGCGVGTNKPSESQGCSITCTPNWVCTDWTTCISSQQVRSCTDSNSCNINTNKPETSKSCSSECVPDWVIGEWSECTDGVQTRTITDSNDCGVTQLLATSQSCEGENYTMYIIIGAILVGLIIFFAVGGKKSSGSSSGNL